MKYAINLLILLTVATGCAKKEPPPPPKFAVELREVTVGDVPYNLKGIGQLTASISVDVKAQVQGFLTSVLFLDGQLVEEGELLMTIDQRIYEAEVQEAQARLASDQARLRYALDFAQTYGKLVGDEYVSRLSFEKGIQNVDVYRAAIENDLAALKIAEVNLGYTQLRAPIKGYIGARKYDPGTVIYPRIDQALVTINKITPITVNFSLPAEYIHEIKERQKEEPLYVEATLPDDPAHPLQGSLYFIDNKVNSQTGMVFLKATLPNTEERGWPGAFVRVNLRMKMLRDALLVPQNAVIPGHSGNYVFVVDKETMSVTLRMIGKGIYYKDYVVADWGLKPGETVVVDGWLNLYDGAPIQESG